MVNQRSLSSEINTIHLLVHKEKAEARISAQLEYDREKELIDEVVSRIQEEDALEAKIKAAKQEETKAYILEFLKQREEQRKEKIELVLYAHFFEEKALMSTKAVTPLCTH